MKKLIPIITCVALLASCASTKKTGIVQEDGKRYASEVVTDKAGVTMHCYEIVVENGVEFFIKDPKKNKQRNKFRLQRRQGRVANLVRF